MFFLRHCFFSLLFVCGIFLQILYAADSTVRSDEAEVFAEESLTNLAREVLRVYPSVRKDLEETFHWKVDFRPKIFLVKDRETFRKITGSDLILAFAVADRNLIALDTSRILTRPFTLETTLKHELCHLVLHRHIENVRLPRWLDEGVCQWSTGGIAEIVMENGDRYLTKATISDRLIEMRALERFPMDERSLILAYEESRSFVEYIVGEYGSSRLLMVLADMKEGHPVDEAVQKNLSLSLFEIENHWRAHLKRKHTWFLYVSNNLYAILFFLAALVTVYGFFRLMKKKRDYKDDEEDEQPAATAKKHREKTEAQ